MLDSLRSSSIEGCNAWFVSTLRQPCTLGLKSCLKFPGAGANMALMDAQELTEELVNGGHNNAEQAIRLFAEKAAKRSADAIKSSRMNISLAHSEGWRKRLLLAALGTIGNVLSAAQKARSYLRSQHSSWSQPVFCLSNALCKPGVSSAQDIQIFLQLVSGSTVKEWVKASMYKSGFSIRFMMDVWASTLPCGCCIFRAHARPAGGSRSLHWESSSCIQGYDIPTAVLERSAWFWQQNLPCTSCIGLARSILASIDCSNTRSYLSCTCIGWWHHDKSCQLPGPMTMSLLLL